MPIYLLFFFTKKTFISRAITNRKFRIVVSGFVKTCYEHVPDVFQVAEGVDIPSGLYLPQHGI